MIICVDFDGTCVTHEYPIVGKEIGSVSVLKKIIKKGHKIILFTMRSGKYLDDAVNWFREKEIDLYGINQNPTQKSWTSSPKAFAQLYIDDAALGCPLKVDNNLSMWSFADWDEIENILKNKKIID